ncbi:MAG: response regulator [Thermacetogeniaceae bacterium]
MTIRVLVVDDSPFIHKAIARALPEDEYEICGVGKNGREGIELYQKLAPDIVTMDVTMPIVDGIQAAGEILKGDPRACIILLSAMGDEELIQQAKAMGIKTTVQKPFKAPELLAAINMVYKPKPSNPAVSPVSEQPATYSDYFRSALENTLKEMADLDCSCGRTEIQEGILASKGVAVILGVTGKRSGRIILDTSREVACCLSEAMNGEKYELEDDFILYSLSEILNILSGKAITRINNIHKDTNLRLGPPSIFVGNPLNINSPKIKAEIIKATTTAGDISLNVGFEGGDK